MRNGVLGITALLTGVILFVQPQHAAAQEVADNSGPIEEIVVTTQRREENMQSVPVAVTAFSGEALDEMGIVDIKGITERTPGFTMGVFNPGQPQFYIRGIGSNEDGAGGDQSVIVFIDEVYIGRAAGSDFDLFDLERVEVLRGPQGTLFGKNVVGGAVSLVTKKPTEETEFALQGTLGNLDAITMRGLASGQVAENLFAKVSFSSRRRDGYVDTLIDRYPQFFPNVSSNLLGDFEQHNVDTESLRAALRWLPSDTVEVNVSTNFSTMDRAGPTYLAIGPGGIPFLADSSVVPGYGRDIHENLVQDPGRSENDIWGITGRVDWDVNDTMTFTSLSSFRKVEATQQWYLGGPTELNALRLSQSAVPLFLNGTNDYTDDSDTFTHEFRLTGTSDRMYWVAGMYYLQEDTDRNETAPIGLDFSDGMGGIGLSVPVIDGGDLQENETTSYAVFGQVTFDLTENVAITLGGRQTWEEKDICRLGTPTATTPNRIFDFCTGEDWDSFTGKFGVEWQATEDAFFYLSISEGFKSGGYQGLAANELIAITPFDPEEAILYEIGAKTEWFDNRLRLNTAVFFTDYTDLQILQLLVENDAPVGQTGQLITQNAADAEIQGVEIEFTIAPTDYLTIQGSYTHLDTEFSDFFVPSGFRPPDLGAGGAAPDRTGNDLRNAPDNAYNLLVRLDFPLDSGGAVALQADWRHKDKVYQDPDLLEFAAVPEYDVLDLRATYYFSNGNLEATAWARNALDEEYFLHNFPLQGSGLATPAPPRTYGLTVTWRNE